MPTTHRKKEGAMSKHKWTIDEINSFMGYILSSDEESLNDRLEFAIYMNHYESGKNYPIRSLSSSKKKYYQEIKKNKSKFYASKEKGGNNE